MSFAEVSQPVLVWTGRVMLAGSMAVPDHASAAVIVVAAPTLPNAERDEKLNDELTRYGVATLYVSLLTDEELQFDSTTHQYRYDSDFLEQRLVDVVAWVKSNDKLRDLPTGVVATSGSAAAVIGY
jgi:putative phosphoribosyl transferase